MSGDQSNAAAERSAHVERGPARRIPGEAFLSEVSPGVFQLKALVEALGEVERRAQAENERKQLAEAITEAIAEDLGGRKQSRALPPRALPPQTGRELFPSRDTLAPPAPSGGLFGGAPAAAGGGLFGGAPTPHSATPPSAPSGGLSGGAAAPAPASGAT